MGYSREPPRRLRQHNGELRGGAAPVAGRPWELVLIVSGFHSKRSALAFESAWQRPHTSRHVSREWNALGFSKCSGATSVHVRLEALCLILRHGAWVSEALSVRVVCTRGRVHMCGSLSSHVSSSMCKQFAYGSYTLFHAIHQSMSQPHQNKT